MKPTVIEFPAPLNAALEQLAQQTGRSPQDLIQEAVKIYLTHQHALLPPSVGMGASGRGDLSQRDEELLWQDR
jgi:predicted transcriptional regulator